MFEWVSRRVMARRNGAGPVGPESPGADDSQRRIMERRHIDRRATRGRRRLDSVGRGSETSRVLIIDPHEGTRLLYAMLFEEAGYTVYAAMDGPSGLAIAQHNLPDVVVMEIARPTTNGGFDILGQLRDNPVTANIPVVVVTSYLRFNTPARARASGAILVLEKPSDPETLIGSVRELTLVTPPERSLKRQLTRTLLTLRMFGKHLKPDADAQQRVRALIDRLQLAVLALDQQGRYVAASRGASSLTGYSRGELLKMSIFDSPLDVDLSAPKRWQEFLGSEQDSGTATVRNGSGRSTKVEAAFLTIVPGLHAAAIAPAPDAR